MMDVCFVLKSRHGVIQSRSPLSASNRYPENRNEGPIATLTSHAYVRTIGILPTKPKARDAGSIAAPANAIRRLFYDYFINVIGTSARWMTFMATEPRSRP